MGETFRFRRRGAVIGTAGAILLSLIVTVPAGASDQFVDVAADHTFHDDIAFLADEGITKGCNPPANDRYCPSDAVTRGAMGAFLNRAFNLPTASQDHFVDDNGHTFEGDINRLAGAGITKGCNPPANDRFCPNDSVTREAMAAFLVRALELTDAEHPGFTDVAPGSTFEVDIKRLAKAGITRGCNPPDNDRFCPKDEVTRGAMAAFIHRALGGGAPTPDGLDFSSPIGSDVEHGAPSNSDPEGSAAGDVNEPGNGGDIGLQPGITELPSENIDFPLDGLSLSQLEEMESSSILTPNLDIELPGGLELQSHLPFDSQGYLTRSALPSAVGWIVMQGPTGVSYCSGTLVARNVVLTAAHCLVGQSAYWFLPGEYGVLSGHPFYATTSAYVPTIYPQLTGDWQAAFDYGVLVLDADSSGEHAGDRFGWFKIWMSSPASTSLPYGRLLNFDWSRTSIGYPKEGAFGRHCKGGGCYPWQVKSTQGEAFTLGGGFYLNRWGGQTSGGNSGGGVFRYINGQWYVVTMFTATVEKVSCAQAGFATYEACGSHPQSDRYFGLDMWGPPLLRTNEPNYGFDDFWRLLWE